MSSLSHFGRMRRRTFGLTVIGTFVAGMGLAAFGGVGAIMTEAVQGRVPTPATLAALYQPRWLFLALTVLISLWMTWALVRRLNDLEWPAWIAYVYFAITLAATIYQYMDFDRVMINSGNYAAMGTFEILTSAFGLFSLIVFLIMIFKRGTVGPNAHGADPSV